MLELMSEFVAEHAESVGVGIALVALVVSSYQQGRATRLSARVSADAAAGELRERLGEAGRRLERARACNRTQEMVYELNYMSSAIEGYLRTTTKIHQQAGLQATEMRALVVGGAVRVLATGLPKERGVSAGDLFKERGFPEVGKLADELGVPAP